MAHHGLGEIVVNPYLGPCKDCRWWDDTHDAKNWGYCLAAEGGTGPKEHHFLFFVGSDDPAALVTHANFGCVHFDGRRKLVKHGDI